MIGDKIKINNKSATIIGRIYEYLVVETEGGELMLRKESRI